MPSKKGHKHDYGVNGICLVCGGKDPLRYPPMPPVSLRLLVRDHARQESKRVPRALEVKNLTTKAKYIRLD